MNFTPIKNANCYEAMFYSTDINPKLYNELTFDYNFSNNQM